MSSCPNCHTKVGRPTDFGEFIANCPRCYHSWYWTEDSIKYNRESTPEYYRKSTPSRTKTPEVSQIPIGKPVLVGLGFLAGTVLSCFIPGLLLVHNLAGIVCFQAGLSAGSVVCFVYAVIRYKRINNREPLAFDQTQSNKLKWRLMAVAFALLVIFWYPFFRIDEFLADDHLFHVAIEKADKDNSPVPLRDYLANSKKQGNREEARRRIAVYYDLAIADLKRRAEACGKEINTEFFDGIIALLEAMKQADKPDVTVVFRGRMDSLPVSVEQKQNERARYDMLLEKHPELRNIAERQADKTAILSLGNTFGQIEIARREKVILERLSKAVNTVIKRDVLSFRMAEASEKPMIDIAYHIKPSGRLYLYVTEGRIGEEIVKGIIRGYEIKWNITIQPPGDGNGRFAWNLDSEGLGQLHYDHRGGDPEWAPYAVVFYSGFYDMAGRLIRNFGLDSGPAPDTFSYEAVASNTTDNPLPRPGNPNRLPLPNPQLRVPTLPQLRVPPPPHLPPPQQGREPDPEMDALMKDVIDGMPNKDDPDLQAIRRRIEERERQRSKPTDPPMPPQGMLPGGPLLPDEQKKKP